ncbi:MAG: hypothetical protein J0M12_06700 [Deltaproteobacteria bacterium]|nr:hypothetical protein [Deltaproteobacteria bacterium]
MAVCLDYQAVYCRRSNVAISVKTQLVAAVLLLLALSSKVWIKIESTDLGYRLAKERQVTIDLDMQRRELELARSVLLRPDNLANMTKSRLGLGLLRPEQARKVVY